MNNQELSREFDLMYNNLNSNQAPGLNEYEKSLVLTEAQEMIVVGVYNGSAGAMSFEETEEATAYLSPLVKEYEIANNLSSEEMQFGTGYGFQWFLLPDDLMFIIHEECDVTRENRCHKLETKVIPVLPVTHDELDRIVRNPFKGPNENRILRLSTSSTDGERKSELVSKYGVTKYRIRYVKRPTPIVLEALPDGLTIEGVGTSTESILPPFLHRKLLMQAVSLAKSFWA